ncbi:MAG: hypothetical protein ACKOYN_01875 [Planctomycetota bacterium]
MLSLLMRHLTALVMAAHLTVSAAGQSMDRMIAIHPIPRPLVDGFVVEAAIPEASAKTISDAYERYREQSVAMIAKARVAVEDAGFGELQEIIQELGGGRAFNPITGAGGLERDPELRRRMQEVHHRIAVSTIPAINAHRSAMRELIESMERVAEECAVSFPRPRWVVLSSLEPTLSHNPLDPKLVDVSVLVRDSMSNGTLRACAAELTPEESQRFLEHVSLALNAYCIRAETALTRRHLAPLKESTAFRPPGSVDMGEDLARAGIQWRGRFQINAEAVSAIGALVATAGGDSRARAWEDEYRAAVCAPLFAEFWPNRLGAWMREQSDASAQDIARADALEARYKAELVPRRDQAYRSVVAAAEASGFATFAVRESPKHEQCHEALLRLHLLGRETMVQFASGLSPDQQERLRRTWLAFGRDIAGPLPDQGRLRPKSTEALLDWPGMPTEWGW